MSLSYCNKNQVEVKILKACQTKHVKLALTFIMISYEAKHNQEFGIHKI